MGDMRDRIIKGIPYSPPPEPQEEKVTILKREWEETKGLAATYQELLSGKTVNGRRLVDAQWIEERKSEIEGLQAKTKEQENFFSDVWNLLRPLEGDRTPATVLGELSRLVEIERQRNQLQKQYETETKKMANEIQKRDKTITKLEGGVKVLEEKVRVLENTQGTTPTPETPLASPGGEPDTQKADVEATLRQIWEKLLKIVKRG